MTYYATSDSDRSYASQARRRVKRGELRTWAIRLLVVVALGLLAWAYGPDLWTLVISRAGTTAEDFKQAGDYIHRGAERRGGAELNEETP